MTYRWKVLRVNLSTGSVEKEPLNKDWAEKYFGGKGLGIKYLYEELEGGIDPLSPANKLILATGPFTGTIVPCSGKLALIAKSPATGTILDCSIGGHFASQLKYAGYDMLIVEGQAEGPVYLVIDDEKVEIRDAASLWGKGIFETESRLHKEHGVEARVLSIGPAGENLVPIACVGSEYYRQAGRGGIGSVMGSKRLKAVVCSGSKDITVPDMPRLLELVKKAIREDVLTATNLGVYVDGTPQLIDMSQTAGVLPTRNYQNGVFEGAQKINAAALRELKPQVKACFACALGCGHYTGTKGSFVEGPEYETLALVGSNCGVDDLEAIIKFNADCDDFGIDTISAGNVVGFAMEMTEKGIKDFGIRFGDIETYLKMPRMIARQEGIGKELSRGVRYLAKTYGGTEFAMEVKGLELPGYDPRGSWGMGLAYATADRGGCHMRAWPIADEAFGKLDPFTIEGKAKLVITGQHYNSVKFSLILCDFWALSLETMSKVISCVLGREVSVADLQKAGERIWNLSRLFNVREGFKAADDSLPARIFKDPLKSGAAAGRVLPRDQFDSMLREYYQLRGWDSNGVPTPEKLKELEM
jgi:aldehyde:ferredoxin oxidoreductase